MKKIFRSSPQKYFCLAVFALAMAVLPGCAHAAPQSNITDNLGPNLIKNNSFEDGATSWAIPENMATIVSDVAHSGKNSLFYKRTDAKVYRLFTQSVAVKPGDLVHFSAWVKGENLAVSGKLRGATICIQAMNGKKFLGGEYPDGFLGTFDWKRIALAYLVPKDATEVSLALYLGKDVTGSAWFDDVEVRVEKPTYFKTRLQAPSYRGTVVRGDNSPWKVMLRKPAHAREWTDDMIYVNASLVDAQGKVLLRETTKSQNSALPASFTLQPPSDLPEGDYSLQLTFTGRNGIIKERDQHVIKVVPKMPGTYIDGQGFTVVDGKRFFPMGVYLGAGTSNDANLKRVSEGSFNTVLSYEYGIYGTNNRGLQAKNYMESAHKYNLKVIYALEKLYAGKGGLGDDAKEIAAQYIDNLKNEPALLAWYTNDEMSEGWQHLLDERYAQIKRLDPEHLVFQVQNEAVRLEDNADSTDVLASDVYPVGRSADLAEISARTRVTAAAAHGTKGTWFVPQIMNWTVYDKKYPNHPPTLDEMRNQAYQAIINGATGLIWYSYYDMMYEKYPRNESTKNMDLFNRRWKDVTAMAKEVNAVAPVILQDKKVTLETSNDKSEVQAAAWQDGDELLLLLANPYYEEKSITFALPKGWQIKDANQGEIKSTFADGKATFTLPSVGSGVFRLVQEK